MICSLLQHIYNIVSSHHLSNNILKRIEFMDPNVKISNIIQSFVKQNRLTKEECNTEPLYENFIETKNIIFLEAIAQEMFNVVKDDYENMKEYVLWIYKIIFIIDKKNMEYCEIFENLKDYITVIIKKYQIFIKQSKPEFNTFVNNIQTFRSKFVNDQNNFDMVDLPELLSIIFNFFEIFYTLTNTIAIHKDLKIEYFNDLQIHSLPYYTGSVSPFSDFNIILNDLCSFNFMKNPMFIDQKYKKLKNSLFKKFDQLANCKDEKEIHSFFNEIKVDLENIKIRRIIQDEVAALYSLYHDRPTTSVLVNRKELEYFLECYIFANTNRGQELYIELAVSNLKSLITVKVLLKNFVEYFFLYLKARVITTPHAQTKNFGAALIVLAKETNKKNEINPYTSNMENIHNLLCVSFFNSYFDRRFDLILFKLPKHISEIQKLLTEKENQLIDNIIDIIYSKAQITTKKEKVKDFFTLKYNEMTNNLEKKLNVILLKDEFHSELNKKNSESMLEKMDCE